MRLRILFILILVAAGFTTIPTHAQQKITISLAVPADYRNLFAAQIGAFHATNSDIQITLVTSQVRFPDVTADLNGYLDSVKALASSADVVLVDSASFSPFATRTQSFLDLKPFTDTDPMLNAADFYPAVRRSFQWDGGEWAIPFAEDVGVLTYDSAVFDQAGLTYPSPQWTLNDLANAARKLSQKAPDGKMLPGLDTSNAFFQAALFRSLLSDSLFDPSVIPNPPQFDRPDVVRLLDIWSALIKEGVVSQGNNAPLDLTDAQVLNTAEHKLATLLPGGHAALRAFGLAVSKGTRYPYQAYALATYFAGIPGLTLGDGELPARQSLIISNGNNRAQTAARQAIERALPASDLRYVNYLSIALRKMTNDGLDAHSALQAAQSAAMQDLQLAENTAKSQSISVPTPIPAVKGASINFFVPFSNKGYTNADLWKRLIEEFVNHDPEIKQINLSGDQQWDCHLDTYSSASIENGFYPTAWLGNFSLDLKPLISMDSSFNPSDFIGDSLHRVQFGDKMLGYPIAIMPAFLKYDPAQFKRAGVPEPTNDWTINDFVEALKRLKDTSQVTPFQQSFTLARGVQPGALHLTLLMAAFGASPIDYGTTPATLKDDTVALDSTQQVLDLVKNGYIKFYENGFGYINQDLWGTLSRNEERPPITTEVLNPYTTRHLLNGADQNDPYRAVFYPRGSHARPVAYDVIAAVINPKSPYPDGCYRWIKFLAIHPELIQAMPASRMALDNPLLSAIHGSDLVMFYKQMDQLLQSSDVVIFPLRGGKWADLFADYWVGQAFNAYVLNGADLKTSLTQAVSNMQAYLQQCDAKNSLPPDVPSDVNILDRVANAYIKALKRCAWQIDPSLVKYG